MNRQRIKVAVIRGGPSSEYEVSLKTGNSVLRNLSAEHEGHDVFIDRAGRWHYGGVPHLPEHLLRHFDVVFNALHGEYGEDGKVQRLLRNLGVRYTGSRALASAMAMDKVLTKERVAGSGIRVPIHAIVVQGDDLRAKALELWRTFPQPCVVKPAGLGSSVGLTLVKTFDQMEPALRLALQNSAAAVVEEYISGKEATVGVIDDFRDKKMHALPPVEIRLPAGKDLFDYEAKYGGATEELCPGSFTPEEVRELKRLAEAAHGILNLRHYSRSDFIVTPKRGIYFLETNTLPGLTNESLLPKALATDGSSLQEFLRHIIQLARKDDITEEDDTLPGRDNN